MPQPVTQIRALLPLLILSLIVAACRDDATDDDAHTPLPVTTAAAPSTPTASTPSPAGTATPDATTRPATDTPQPPTPAPTPEPTPTELPLFDATGVSLDVEPVADGFNGPLFVMHAGDGSGRAFVVEKPGTVRLLDGAVYLDIRDRVGSEGSEQGLLGLAFHPQFTENGFLYVNYTDLNGDTVISRFQEGDDGAVDPAGEFTLITWDQPDTNHNGGMLAFGPDGYLYIGLGDGGGAYDEYRNAQRLDTLLGKLLRIDVDGGDPYGIPPDNPFADDPDARPEIWAYGLRNPWRFAFDESTGDLYIADVGQRTWEWVLVQEAGVGGQNYGWPIIEGGHCVQEGCDMSGFELPVYAYGRDKGCAIIGGDVYRGQDYPMLQGAYLFGDLCSGRIWTLARTDDGGWTATEMLMLDGSISSFGADEAGELYVTDLYGGIVYRITARAT